MLNSNSQYINFTRKYRPANFAELYGQEVLTKVLSNAIQNNRLAQGYLLTGIRGVGKTTSARIIAKTINCTNLITLGRHIKPCDECANCDSFNKYNHPDIIEMDAASRTSVDDIRKIIESSEYRPLLSKYKVFIIDEVHMLSKGAFNALLKILEEPPPHLIFIFATTEVQKIPLTVISRCQRYDLRRLTFDEILQLLTQISEKEHLKYDIEALKIIASYCDGSAREAISHLDQATSFCANEQGNKITLQMVNTMLGLVEVATVFKFFKYIISKNTSEAINLINDLYLASTNLEIFIQCVSSFIAFLSKSKMIPGYSSPLYESINSQVNDILQEVSLLQLSIFWQIFNNGIQDIKNSHNQLIDTEMLVMKAIYSKILPFPEELANGISGNEQTNLIDCHVSQGTAVHTKTKVEASGNQVTDFLAYLHKNNEMEFYYLLLNQVEIKQFNNNVIEVAGPSINTKIKEPIANLLFTWTGKKWDVIITNQLKIISLKEQLINKVKASKEWEMLVTHFPDTNVLDILLQTKG